MNKKITLKIKYTLLIAFITYLYPFTTAYAGYLTINGTTTITASIEADQIKITGSYQIENKGNETAQNVFPALKLDSWSWSGEQKNIAANAKETWEINSSFAKSVLFRKEINDSNLNDFKPKGQFPILVQRHYEDLNGVHFSAADLAVLTIGDLTPEELSAIRIPTLNGSFSCQNAGAEFTCSLDYKNMDTSKKKVFTAFHTSQDLQVNPAFEVDEIEERGHKISKVEISNFSGLVGSSYAVFAILQWNENGINKLKSFSNSVSISDKNYNSLFFGSAVVAVLLSGLLLYIFVFSHKKKADS